MGGPVSPRYFQTLSLTKSISKLGAKVYLAVMVRLAQAPFLTPSLLPTRSSSGTEDPPPHALLLLGPSQTSPTNKAMEKNKRPVILLQVAQGHKITSIQKRQI